ncbi:MAG: hypothetical protein P4L84_17400 [Isosphaeraceae bacterium]|nr:hypothetical protein [Isosphaeraceae bacterium]
MKSLRLVLALGAAALGVLLTSQWGLRAQDEKGPKAEKPTAKHEENLPAAVSVQEALQRPFTMPFGEPTTLNDVCRHLRMMLKAPVVLDLAALDRLERSGEDTVQLDLHDGVRLKTGLKLLLDQVGLTYRVVPEDNLLIVTDRTGSEDPLDRIESELKALHRDLHDVQDAVDEIRMALGVDEADGMKMRKPTIIEEIPEEAPKGPENEKKKGEGATGTSSSRSRPGI